MVLILKGKITLIRRVRSEQEIPLGYEIAIETDEEPNLKLGECEITQSKKLR